MRTMGLLAAIGALALVPAAASAAPLDMTSGSASYECVQNCGATAIWTAHGTPVSARGEIRIIMPGIGLDSRGTVDCVDVDGNRATVSGRLSKPHPGLEGPFYALRVEDNGPGRTDRMDVGSNRFPVQCEFGNEFPPVFPVSRGNVVVKDNTP